jgi:hypothetical protein
MVNILWLGTLWNNFNLGFLNPQSTNINHVPHVSHPSFEILAFAKIQLEVKFLKLIKRLLQMMHVIP